MAARIGFTLAALQRLHPGGACADDSRLVWKDGDVQNWGIVRHGEMYNLGLSGVRELRLLAAQMIAAAEYAESESRPDPFEVVLP